MSSERAYIAYLLLEKTTNVLFGSHNWFTPIYAYRGTGAWIQDWGSEYLLLGTRLALGGLLPVCLALLSLLRIMRRRRWLRRVGDGRIFGWRLLEATMPRSVDLPVLTGDARGAVKVLARVTDTADPFRTVDVEPVALVAARSDRGSGRGSSEREAVA